MSDQIKPFLGFQFNGKHSSEFGILRTSDGSRFNENLLPTQQNRTVNIPGRDETYFFGSDSTQRQFNINYAFDGMTQEQLNELRVCFGDKNIHDLIFDERDNVVWQAKISSSSIKYLPFDGKTPDETIYKGEGTLQFTCYQPYGIQKRTIGYVAPNTDQAATYGRMAHNTVINDGALPADWELWIPFQNREIKTSITIGNNEFALDIISPNTDGGIVISSKTGFIEGYYVSTGTNKHRSRNLYRGPSSGKIAKIPVGDPITCNIEGDYPNWEFVCYCKYY